MRRKIVSIIHFQPLELFPPAMNMIDYLGKQKEVELIVFTNRNSGRKSLKTYQNRMARIFRPASLSHNGLRQYLNYAVFYFMTFMNLLRFRPDTVLYIETLSSWPALWYKKIRGKRVRLMVHYHEYTEPRLYKEGMLLSRWMHKAERKTYPTFSWISHTNPVRLEMFKMDCELNDLDPEVFHALPNYPSKSWSSAVERPEHNGKQKRLVFVGSLGYQNMYLQEVIDWLAVHPENFSLDIYSYNIDTKAREAIQNSGLLNITFQGGSNYQELPKILSNYDIGLVIYKPFSQNTIHAVSNKVFEYLACGLDVWFSEDMTYTYNYITDKTYPRVLPVNFRELAAFNYDAAISRAGRNYVPSDYFYENVFPELFSHILTSDERIY